MSWVASPLGAGANSTISSMAGAQNEHPPFGELILLVFEAVLEVVFVALPGYIVARSGMFDTEAQKFVANLNVQVFTPCLIFSKLASKLSVDKMGDLVVIPVIFAAQTLVSYASALLVSRAFGFKKRPRNFVVAMGVFGNSNSLPISLVLSLANTISGLHWDQIPGDSDTDVAARGILYLMIFQQLGQLMRWTWGFNVLLKPAEYYSVAEGGDPPLLEEGYRDEPDEIDASRPYTDQPWTEGSSTADEAADEVAPIAHVTDRRHSRSMSKTSASSWDPVVAPMPTTPINEERSFSSATRAQARLSQLNGNGNGNGHQLSGSGRKASRRPSFITRGAAYSQHQVATLRDFSGRKLSPAFRALPHPVQHVLSRVWHHVARFGQGVWEFMNPPLWAMLAALVVASVPALKHLFFTRGTFINNSLTSAVTQTAGVAVPLILVVLGANLARSTQPTGDLGEHDRATLHLERQLLVASIISRMVLPLLVMAPLLAVAAKFVPVSILDDPIFIIVCFLLTGAPSALQLAQICQIHNVYMGTVTRLLVHSYVIWLLPSTLVLVTAALKVVEWATE